MMLHSSVQFPGACSPSTNTPSPGATDTKNSPPLGITGGSNGSSVSKHWRSFKASELRSCSTIAVSTSVCVMSLRAMTMSYA